MFNNGANNGPSFLPRLYTALANFPVALAPLDMAVRAPTTIVVIIPAMEIAKALTPSKFSFAHSLNRSSLFKSFIDSLSSAVSSIISLVSLFSSCSSFSVNLM